MSVDSQMASPCTGVCKLDANNVCLGCFRTGHEIRVWRDLDSAQKYVVLERVKERQHGSDTAD